MKNQKTKKKKMTLEDKAVAAMEEAVADVVEDHRRRNAPLAVWRNGKVVMLSPDEVSVLRESSGNYSVRKSRCRKV